MTAAAPPGESPPGPGTPQVSVPPAEALPDADGPGAGGAVGDGPAPLLGEEFERWSAALAADRPDPGGGAAAAVALGLAAALIAMVSRCTTPGRGSTPDDEEVAADVLAPAEAVRRGTAALADADARASRGYVEALRAAAGGAQDDGAAAALTAATRAAADSAVELGRRAAALVADLERLADHAPAVLRSDVAVAALLLSAALRAAAVTAGAGADAPGGDEDGGGAGSGPETALEGAALRSDAIAARAGGLSARPAPGP